MRPTGQVFTARTPVEPVGTIAVPIRDQINAATAMSLWHLDLTDLPVDRVFIQGSVLTLQRNEAVQRMRGDWLFFIDDDMSFAPQAVKQLVQFRDEYDLDIVGGLCFRRTPPFQPTIYRFLDGRYEIVDDLSTGTVFECDATGLAFCLIHRRVFEAISGEFPPLERRLELPPPDFFTWQGGIGEDLRFMQDAKAAGARIFVDTRIEIEHIGELRVNRNTWEAARDQR